MAKTSAVFSKINSLRERYYKASIGKDALIKLISEAEIADQVYNSNAIENSTLSLEETEKILLQIDLDRYISEREIFEAKNLARVVSSIDKRAKEEELGFDVILSLHKMLMSNIRDEIAGRFRKDDEYVRVGSHIAPAQKKLTEALRKCFQNTMPQVMKILSSVSHGYISLLNISTPLMMEMAVLDESLITTCSYEKASCR